ncbi:hypothetical protein AB0M43_14500 [Longispora sp. NPDC051575]|uniref:hypothetical protein n=1 Tax=Longispora sp. NPDC051575 TaxID=3154943 RepID=UPI003429155F
MPTTTWWRLRDVAALAEHAMNAPEHRLIREQTEPALLWEHTSGGHILTSSGLPGWHLPDGRAHHATARMWTHTPTGERGGADTIPRDGALALNKHFDKRRKFILQIRDSIGSRHWLAVTALEARPWISISAHPHRDDIAPPHALWIPAMVTADETRVAYPALIADGYTWNGSVLARFAQDTVARIAADIAAVHRAGETRFSVRLTSGAASIDYDYPGAHGTVTRTIDRVHRDADGLYSLGTYQWRWYPALDE